MRSCHYILEKYVWRWVIQSRAATAGHAVKTVRNGTRSVDGDKPAQRSSALLENIRVRLLAQLRDNRNVYLQQMSASVITCEARRHVQKLARRRNSMRKRKGNGIWKKKETVMAFGRWRVWQPPFQKGRCDRLRALVSAVRSYACGRGEHHAQGSVRASVKQKWYKYTTDARKRSEI